MPRKVLGRWSFGGHPSSSERQTCGQKLGFWLRNPLSWLKRLRKVGLALFLLILGVLAACTAGGQQGGGPRTIRHVRRLLSFRDGQAVTRGLVLVPLHVPPGCLHLRDVCADQQSLVLFNPKYRPDAPRPVSIPAFAPAGAKYNFPWLAQSNPDPLATEELQLPPLGMRAASASEPTPDLQQPAFAANRLPLLLYPTWQENYSHTLGNNIGWLFTHLVKSSPSWASAVRLVLYTPYGLAVPPHWHGLATAITPHPLQSFAEFSARFINNSSRCYKDMLVCAADDMGHASNLWQATQHILQHHLPSLPPLEPPIEWQPDSQATSNPIRAWGPSAAATLVRVVFARRDGAAVRQMSNLDELLRECNMWTYRTPATGRLYRAVCGSWIFTNLTTSIAVAQQADVLIGVHGANMANSWFMRPGSSAIEIFPPAWPWNIHRQWLEQDPLAQLQWWGLIVKDPAAYSPGALELQMASKPGLYQGRQGLYKLQRDRNVRVPWVGIEMVLREVAAARGSMGVYRAAVLQRRQLWEVTATSVGPLEVAPPSELLLDG